MNKAVFLDRDGTINVDKNYIYKPEDFEFLDGAVEGLRMLQNMGFLLVIITNQSGIARGYYTEEDYKVLNNYMNDKLNDYGVHITKDYYCPHLSDALIPEYRCVCDCRKPGIGLLSQAVKELNIDLSKSYCIGDRLRDLTICKSSDCKGYLIGETESVENIAVIKGGKYKNITYCISLYDSVKNIEKQL